MKGKTTWDVREKLLQGWNETDTRSEPGIGEGQYQGLLKCRNPIIMSQHEYPCHQSDTLKVKTLIVKPHPLVRPNRLNRTPDYVHQEEIIWRLSYIAPKSLGKHLGHSTDPYYQSIKWSLLRFKMILLDLNCLQEQKQCSSKEDNRTQNFYNDL